MLNFHSNLMKPLYVSTKSTGSMGDVKFGIFSKLQKQGKIISGGGRGVRGRLQKNQQE